MATRIQKSTAERMIAKLQGQLDSLFQHQEMGKGGTMGKQGAIPKAPYGMQLGNALGNMFNMAPKGLGFNPLAGQSIGYNTAALGLLSNQTGNPGTPLGQGLLNSGSNAANYSPFVSKGNKAFGATKVGQFLGVGNGGFGNALQAGTQMAPFMYNAYQGMQPPEQYNYQDFRNPEYGSSKAAYDKASRLGANLRHDPGQELEAAEQANAVYQQGLQNLPTSIGGLQQRKASAATKLFDQRSGIFRNAKNQNNQYRLAQAGIEQGKAGFLANLGGSEARMKLGIADINSRNVAAQQDFQGAAATNLQQYSLMQQLMKNQQQNDDRRFNLAQSLNQNYKYDKDYNLKYRGN